MFLVLDVIILIGLKSKIKVNYLLPANDFDVPNK